MDDNGEEEVEGVGRHLKRSEAGGGFRFAGRHALPPRASADWRRVSAHRAQPAHSVDRDVVGPSRDGVGIVEVLGPDQVLRPIQTHVGRRLGAHGRVQLQPELFAPCEQAIARRDPHSREHLRLRQNAHDKVPLRNRRVSRVAVRADHPVVDVRVQSVRLPAVPLTRGREREALNVAGQVPLGVAG
eukprot:3713835-Rhodomonas_salina.2